MGASRSLSNATAAAGLLACVHVSRQAVARLADRHALSARQSDNYLDSESTRDVRDERRVLLDRGVHGISSNAHMSINVMSR